MPLDEQAQALQRELYFRTVTLAKPPVAVARAMAQAASDVYFDAGAVIFREGDRPESLYFVLEGEVVLETANEEPWSFKRGSAVGVLDVNLERPRARTATAVTYVHALCLKGEDWLEILEDNFEYSIVTRRAIAADLQKMVLELAPSGGFESPPVEDDLAAPPEMNPIARLVVLRNVELFKFTGVQALASVAAVAESIAREPGELMFQGADSDQAIYVVAWGTVEMDRLEAPTIHATFGPAMLIGGSLAFSGLMHSYRVRAVTRAVMLRIRLTDFDDVAEDHFELTRSVSKSYALHRERLMLLRGRARTSVLPAAVEALPVRKRTG